MSKIKLNFADYSEALLWIESRAKQYKSMNEFYCSDEYKAAYPLIKKMHEVEVSAFAKKAMGELKKSGLKIGDRVEYDYVSPFFTVTTYTGKIIERLGMPYVKFDAGLKTMTGKSSVRWHRGFVKLTK